MARKPRIIGHHRAWNTEGPYKSHVTPIPPIGPLIVSAEIGTINGSTVAVTFNQACVTPPVVEIKENGVVTTHDGGTIQEDSTLVYYVIPIPWHGSDDVITVDGHAVTNNITWLSLLDLQADTIPLSINDPIPLWSDATIYNHDFTQTDPDARPLLGIESNYLSVFPDGIDDWMLGGDWGDNLDSFGIIACGYSINVFISKILNTSSGAGWALYSAGATGLIQEAGGNNWIETDLSPFEPTGARQIFTMALVNKATLHMYLDGDNSNEADNSAPPVNNYSTTQPVRLFTYGNLASFGNDGSSAIMFVTPLPPNTDRVALERRTAERYGATYP